MQTLRGEQYFGQYGKIVKIVVNKRTAQDPAMVSYNDGGKNSGGMGVYVTFARKQDAATCIAAVDGSVNGDRVLRFVPHEGFGKGLWLIKLWVGQHTVPPSIARHICGTKPAPIRTACSYMSPGRRRNPLVDWTCHRSTQVSVLLLDRLQDPPLHHCHSSWLLQQ